MALTVERSEIIEIAISDDDARMCQKFAEDIEKVHRKSRTDRARYDKSDSIRGNALSKMIELGAARIYGAAENLDFSVRGFDLRYDFLVGAIPVDVKGFKSESDALWLTLATQDPRSHPLYMTLIYVAAMMENRGSSRIIRIIGEIEAKRFAMIADDRQGPVSGLPCLYLPLDQFEAPGHILPIPNRERFRIERGEAD